MTYNLPDKSISGAGGLEPYVNRFFHDRNISRTYKDFVTLLEYNEIPISTRARTLGISKDAFKNWAKLYQATKQNVPRTTEDTTSKTE